MKNAIRQWVIGLGLAASGAAVPVAAVVGIMAVATTACTDALKTTAKSLNDAALAVSALQNTAIQANTLGVMSRDETARILGICQRINNAGLQAQTVTRNYTALPAGSANVTSIIHPVLVSVQQAVMDDSIVNLKDPNVKKDILLALDIIQTALAGAEAALGGK